MKAKFLFAIIFSFIGSSAFAQDGYDIKAKFTNATPDSLVFLCHYFGKGQTVYKDDSARVTKNGEVIMKSKNKLQGGIYMLLWADKSKSMEFVLLNGDKFHFTADKNDIVNTIKIEGNEENNKFYAYQQYLEGYGKRYQALDGELKTAKSKKDTTAVYDKMQEMSKELTKYRNDFVKNNPKLFNSAVFNALMEPEIPQGKDAFPIGEDGKVDSNYRFKFYKSKYWEKFNFQDDRLIYTPIYDAKIDQYFNKLVMPVPDSVNFEADKLLKASRGTKEVFKYTLWWITRWAETSKIMGMDESFVHLVENYYMKGDATWLEDSVLQKYLKRARDIAPNLVGNKAPDIMMQEKGTNKPVALSSFYPKHDYTILIFWSPDCGHCKKQVPRVDSVVKILSKKYDIGIFASSTEAFDKWDDFISKNNLGKYWYHVSDPQRVSGYGQLYDVYSTPTIYLLDKQGIIRGKRIDEGNFEGLIEFLEKKKKDEKK